MLVQPQGFLQILLFLIGSKETAELGVGFQASGGVLGEHRGLLGYPW